LLRGIWVSNNKEVMNYRLRNKPLRLQEMQSSKNWPRRRVEEELNMRELKTLETNSKYRNKRKEPGTKKEKSMRSD